MTLDEILERARAAYRSGVKPRRADWGVVLQDGTYVPTGERGCCGLGAALIGLPPFWLPPPKSSGLDFSGVRGALGITDEQTEAFTKGFDGKSCRPGLPRDWYDAGKALAAEVFGEGEG